MTRCACAGSCACAAGCCACSAGCWCLRPRIVLPAACCRREHTHQDPHIWPACPPSLPRSTTTFLTYSGRRSQDLKDFTRRSLDRLAAVTEGGPDKLGQLDGVTTAAALAAADAEFVDALSRRTSTDDAASGGSSSAVEVAALRAALAAQQAQEVPEEERWAVQGTAARRYWSCPGNADLRVRGKNYLQVGVTQVGARHVAAPTCQPHCHEPACQHACSAHPWLPAAPSIPHAGGGTAHARYRLQRYHMLCRTRRRSRPPCPCLISTRLSWWRWMSRCGTWPASCRR